MDVTKLAGVIFNIIFDELETGQAMTTVEINEVSKKADRATKKIIKALKDANK